MKYKVKVRRTEAAIGWCASIPGLDPGLIVHDIDRAAAVRRAQAEALRILASRIECGATTSDTQNAQLALFVVVDDTDPGGTSTSAA